MQKRKNIVVQVWLRTLDKIVDVFTHLRPHLDEVFAIALIGLFSDPYFVDKHSINEKFFVGLDGIGFDEHDERGRVEKKTCASKLVWEALGIMQSDKLWIARLVDKICEWDRFAKNRRRDNLGNLLKACYDLGDNSVAHQARYIRWAIYGIQTFLKVSTLERGPIMLDTRWENICNGFRKYIGDNYSSSAIDVVLNQSANDPMSVRAIAEAIWLDEHSKKRVYEWMETALEIIWMNDMLRLDARKTIAKISAIEVGSIRLMVIKNDNPTLHNCVGLGSANPQAHILVQLKRDGSIQIHQKNGTIDMQRVACRIRIAELKKRDLGINSNREGYLVDGTHPRVGTWYLHGKDRGLYNRTLTNPNVPITKLSGDEVVECIMQELNGVPIEELDVLVAVA